jgi:hypothetical protein
MLASVMLTTKQDHNTLKENVKRIAITHKVQPTYRSFVAPGTEFTRAGMKKALLPPYFSLAAPFFKAAL